MNGPDSDNLPTVAQALQHARAAGLERLDAQCLLARQLRCRREWLIAHDDALLAAADQQAFDASVQQRAAGVPLAYLLGEREFHGLALHVGPSVLVPRPETEGLVDWALERLAASADGPAPTIADLGTGSGAIAIALAVALARQGTSARICASDLSPQALQVARQNAVRHAVEIEFVSGRWWQPLAGRRFDLVVANPPYIAADDPHLPALSHEPLLALSPGGDGLDALREIAQGALAHLKPGGALLLEHGFDQGAAVRGLLAAAGLMPLGTRTDPAGLDRCSGGRASGSAAMPQNPG